MGPLNVLKESLVGGNSGRVSPNTPNIIAAGGLTAQKVKNNAAEKLTERFNGGFITENDYMDGLLADMDNYLDAIFTH